MIGARLRDMLQGPSGGYDTARVLYFFGGLSSIISPIAFQIWSMWRGEKWDATAFCLAYGGLLGAVVLAGATGIATKDKGVAAALNTIPPDPGGGQP